MGPLAVGATAWRVPRGLEVESMGQLLAPEFQAKPLRKGSLHIPIGDSKRVNKDKHGHVSLADGARFLFKVAKLEYRDHLGIDAILTWIAPDDSNRLQEVAWYLGSGSEKDHCAPKNIYQETGAAIGFDWDEDRFRAGKAKLESLGFELVDIRARVLDEPEFNRRLERLDNKSSLLSELSLNLAREMVDANRQIGEPIQVFCDKHGGRNRYQAFLLESFQQEWFTILEEGACRSVYTASWAGSPLMVQFQVEGDSIFPSAASSIVAKWIREEMMLKLNRFWQSKSKTRISPTAGYYVDAMRFADQIEPISRELKLGRELWWRRK